MKLTKGALALSAGLGLSAAAVAEPYVDYTPRTGVTEVQMMKVDPNHIDDYLTGLRHEWVAGQELAKRHGVIDSYQLMVKMNAGGGPNVVLISHYPSMANLEPNKERDMAMRKEGLAMIPKEKSDADVAGFEKYRTFVSDDYWVAVDFNK
jgi:hypothetical protein